MDTWDNDAQGVWDTYLEELAKQWTKMQEWSFIYMKQSFAFVQLRSLCICLPIGPRSIVLELCTLLLVFFSFLQKVSGQQILERCIKNIVFAFLVHIHTLTEIQIQKIYLAWIPDCLPSSSFIIIYIFFLFKREILEKFFIFTVHHFF